MANNALTSNYSYRLYKLRKAKRKQVPAWYLVAGAWVLFLSYIGLRHLLG